MSPISTFVLNTLTLTQSAFFFFFFFLVQLGFLTLWVMMKTNGLPVIVLLL